MLQGIQQFLATSGTRNVEDLKVALEMASGDDLGSYFDAWVFGSGVPEWPAFAVDVAQAGGDATVTVTQQNPSMTTYPCTVELEVGGATQAARVQVEFGLDPSSSSASATVPFGEAVTGWTLDPAHRLVGTLVTGNKSASSIPRLPVWIL